MNHLERHRELHESLDELIACFVTSTKRGLTNTSLMDFLKWSHEATKDAEVCKSKKEGA